MMIGTRRPLQELVGKRFYNHGESHSPGLKRQKLDTIPNFLRDCRPSLAPRGDSRTFVLAPGNPSEKLVPKDMVSKCFTSAVSQGKDGSAKAIVNLDNVEKRSLGELGKAKERVRGNATLKPKRSSKFICPKNLPNHSLRSKKCMPPTVRTVSHVVRDFTSDSGDSSSRDSSPRCKEETNSPSISKCKVVVNGKSDLVKGPLVETIKRVGRPEADEDVCQVDVECGMFVANDKCKLKQVEVGTEDLGPRTGTSYENCSKQGLSGDGLKSVPVRQDTAELLEPNCPEKKSLSLSTKAMDAVLRKSEYFLLVKESNNQSSSHSRVDLDRIKVCKALNLFDDIYNKLYQQWQLQPKFDRCNAGLIPIEAAGVAKKQLKSFSMNERVVGTVPGIKVGDQFRFRAQLVLIGLHCPYIFGIDYMKKDGKNVAISIVDSGRYAKGKASDHYTREMKSADVFFYSGQGGNPQVSSFPKELEDQKLEGGNLALLNSMEEKIPVRVIRKLRTFQESNTRAKSGKTQAFSYDGLYVVSNCTQERGAYGKLIFKFQFNRIDGQSKLAKCLATTTEKSKLQQDNFVIDIDISQGKEKIPIRALNAIDKEKPPTFKYVTEMVYAKKLGEGPCCGCDCINGCSDESPCYCLIKNGGEIPYNENGAILKAKSTVYECGPSCKCPPSCKNRVSQNGVRYELEIFKTDSKGWGVRSRNFIASGSFVCEYAGELLTEKEAEKRTNNDEYLFDIGANNDNYVGPNEPPQSTCSKCTDEDGFTIDAAEYGDEDGFTIDAAEYGNIGRFINHSCSPNLFAQKVLYDHDDERRVHIMLFASKNIIPSREFSFDYNYKLGQVRDSSGNIKIKNCYCGTRDCTGRLY